jgi:hypothetical protein
VKLLDFDEIQLRLDERFIPLEPMLLGMRLVPGNDLDSKLAACERQLGITFPKAFASLATRFDFGYLTIGPITFCSTGDYFSWLLDGNQDEPGQIFPWWSGARRPRDIIAIANSDGFGVFLDVKNGKVFVIDDCSDSSAEMFEVSTSFDLFVRTLATAMLERNPDGGNELLARSIASAAGVDQSNRFWEWITR